MKQMFKKQAAMLTLLALVIVSSIHGSPLAFKIENDQAVVVGCNSKFEGELIIPGKFQGNRSQPSEKMRSGDAES